MDDIIFIIISVFYHCLWTILIINSSYSVMNDNNDFVTFVFMVLFRKHRLMLFWSFEIVPWAAPLRPKQQPLISKQNHENACYAVIIHLYLLLITFLTRYFSTNSNSLSVTKNGPFCRTLLNYPHKKNPTNSVIIVLYDKKKFLF